MSTSSSRSDGWTVQYSDNFKAIPHKRSCTDIYCLFVLAVFIFCWCGIGYYAYLNGDISRLTAPKDSMGRTCGVDLDVKENKYLFFYDISECVSLSIFLFGCSTKQICVKECPKETWFMPDRLNNDRPPPLGWSDLQSKLICNDSEVAKTVTSWDMLRKVVKEERCASYYVSSTSAFFHLCLPQLTGNRANAAREISSDIADHSREVKNYFNYLYEVSNIIQQDLKKCWHFIGLFVAVSLLSCLFIIVIMGIITKIVIWIILAIVLIILLYSSLVTYMQYDSMPDVSPNNGTAFPDFYSQTAYGQLQWLFHQKQTWLVLFVVSSGFFLLFSLLVIFLRSRIELAVMLIGEGSKAINAVKSALFFPFITRFLQLLVIVWFVMVYLYVKSLGNAIYTVQGLDKNLAKTECDCDYEENDWCLPHQFELKCRNRSSGGSCYNAQCVFREFLDPQMKYYFHLYNLFGLLWGLYFISGFSRMILSFCFATWYWTYNKYDIPFFTLLYSIFITIRYHLGTIAIGSFLIATCGFIRTLLEHTQRLLKQSDGLVTQCLTWGMRCCFWCLQKFLIFISHNAYIMCAISGANFFSSAEEALGLLARNIIRVVVLDKVLDFLMLVGKLSVTLFWGFASYFAFSKQSLGLHYPAIPALIIAIISWIIASSFFGVYVVAVDTLFLSFLKDGEINDGSQNKPYYMTQKLKYMLKENVKSRKKQSRKQ